MDRQMIDKEIMVDILEAFSKEGKLFSNERQFQLELSWRLKESGYDVLLETLECIEDKKSYIDVVVKVSEKEYVAIELKYTTKQNEMKYYIGVENKESVRTFAQGAGDVRQLDYLCDVQRLERLLGKENVFDKKGAKIVKGYAIIMTNDGYSKKKGEGTNYKDVALYRGRKVEPNVEMRIYTKGYENRVVKLKYPYTCDWQLYNLNVTNIDYYTGSRNKRNKKECGYEQIPFEYMIWEIVEK